MNKMGETIEEKDFGEYSVIFSSYDGTYAFQFAITDGEQLVFDICSDDRELIEEIYDGTEFKKDIKNICTIAQMCFDKYAGYKSDDDPVYYRADVLYGKFKVWLEM